MNKMRRIFGITILSIVSFNLCISQSDDCPREVYFLTEQSPQCDGGIDNLNEIFDDLIEINNTIEKIKEIKIQINCKGEISIIELIPMIDEEIIESIEYKLNNIKWRPAHQRNLPVNFETVLKVQKINNKITILNENIAILPTITISGRIIDKNTLKPITSAYISINGENQITTSNENGKFELYVGDDYKEKIVHVAHVGYVEFDFKIPDLKELIVPLQKTFLDFNEFDAVTYFPKKLPYKNKCNYEDYRFAESSSAWKWITIKYANFTGGYECFYNFVIDHFDYPKNAYKNGYKGVAQVEFTIDSIGRPINLVITGDTLYDISTNIQMIINKMPVWQPAIQKNEYVFQDIKFLLKFGENKYWIKKHK